MPTINIKIPEQQYQITVPDISVLFPEFDDPEFLQDLEVRDKIMSYLKYAIEYETEVIGR